MNITEAIVVGGCAAAIICAVVIAIIGPMSDTPDESDIIEQFFTKQDGTPCTIIRIRHSKGFAVTCNYAATPSRGNK